jgi:hypothetical protein
MYGEFTNGKKVIAYKSRRTFESINFFIFFSVRIQILILIRLIFILLHHQAGIVQSVRMARLHRAGPGFNPQSQ